MWILRQKRRGLHDLTRLAVAALWDLLGDPGFLDRMAQIGGETLNGGDPLRAYRAHWRLAGAHRLSIEVHRTRSAQTHAAAILRAGQSQCVAQSPQQRDIGRKVNFVWLAVHHKARMSHSVSLSSSRFHLTLSQARSSEERS